MESFVRNTDLSPAFGSHLCKEKALEDSLHTSPIKEGPSSLLTPVRDADFKIQWSFSESWCFAYEQYANGAKLGHSIFCLVLKTHINGIRKLSLLGIAVLSGYTATSACWENLHFLSGWYFDFQMRGHAHNSPHCFILSLNPHFIFGSNNHKSSVPNGILTAQ